VAKTGNVLDGAVDSEGVAISAVFGTFTTAQGGSVTIASDGSYTYTPPAGFHGSDSFGFTAKTSDDSTNGTVNVNVNVVSLTGNIVVNGTNSDDALIVTATGPDSGSYSLNGGPAVLFTGATSFSFFGLGGNDLMRIIYPAGGTFAPKGGVVYDGGTGNNTLQLDAKNQPLGTMVSALGGQGNPAVQYTNVQQINLENAVSVNAMGGPDTVDRNTAFVGLTADERYVQALYLDSLGRAGSKAELDAWVAVLNGPGGSRVAVANGIQRSFEGRDHLVKSWYFAYLGRQANAGEEIGWVNLLGSATEEQVITGILDSTEFFNRAQTMGFGDAANRNYVRALYRVLLNRAASSGEVDAWMGALAILGPAGVARDFLQSGEFRAYQFEGYYNTLLHRPEDGGGLNGWISSGADLISALIGFEASPEFYLKG
jgi:hypothetical protein